MLWEMQGWIRMIMMISNEVSGDLNFLPSCHDCSMVDREPGSQVLTYLSNVLSWVNL